MERSRWYRPEIFLASRVAGDHGGMFGTQPVTSGTEEVARLTVPEP